MDDYLLLRNHLRSNAKDRALYEATKRTLMNRRWHDTNDYANAKTDVILAIKERARAARTVTMPTRSPIDQYRVTGRTGRVGLVDATQIFEAERPRLLRIAARVLNDSSEAEDIVQTAWLRLRGTDSDIESLPAWLTTVTTRLCLDRLRSRTPEAAGEVPMPGIVQDPAEDIVLAETVGVALQVVLDRLTPSERVAFVLHDSFGLEFATIAAVLDTTTVAARKLASRARAKIGQPAAEDQLADWEVVDAFMAAARQGDFDKLLQLLAPYATVSADPAAILIGTPKQIHDRHDVAAFFNGSAHAALPVFARERPGAAWYDRGKSMVLFDFSVEGGVVQRITFRAEPEVMTQVISRRGPARRN